MVTMEKGVTFTRTEDSKAPVQSEFSDDQKMEALAKGSVQCRGEVQGSICEGGRARQNSRLE